MAAAAVKGIALTANTIAATRQMGADAKTAMPNIQKTKSKAIGGLSLFYGFVPVNPILWGLQMPLLIILTMICAFGFGMEWKSSFLVAYITQAIIVAYFYNTVTSALSSIFFGI